MKKKGLFRRAVLKLLVLGMLLAGIVFVVLIIGICSVIGTDNESNVSGFDTEMQGGFPQQVEGYRELITNLCQEYNTQPDKLDLSLYINAMLAIIEIESGGAGTDPMQASECGYNTEYPRGPGAIQDAEYSCRCGVQYARDAFIKFGVSGPDDMDRLSAAVQGYNFGIDGWYKWLSERGGKYTVDLAKQYSESMMPVGAKGTPTHGQKFLNAYQSGIASTEGGEPLDNIVYYRQWDPRWSNYPYGSSNIQNCGCGVTSMAMVIATLCDSSVTPPVMADMSMNNGGYVQGQGSSMPVVTAAASKKYPIEYKQITADEVEKYINEKQALVIWGCKTGYFSSSAAGHVMLIRKVNDKGDFLLADPNRTENNSKPFTKDFIAGEAKYFIAVWKKG